jgi:DNA-binding CsgD family transcriptional regulator
MATSVRRTGLNVLGDMPWGTHACLFYDSNEDLLDTVIPFFKAGLESNEFCIWATTEPLTVQQAQASLSQNIPFVDRYLAAGKLEILPGREWYLQDEQFDLSRVTRGWHQKLRGALANGRDGMRVSGDTGWLVPNQWKKFYDYEQELDKSIAGRPIIVLCTYPLSAAKALDILDVARVHHCTIARRNREWEFLETPELKRAKGEIKKLNDALGILSKPFSGHELLTPQERVVLAQIVRGASSKDAGQTLGISPRTVEFHRANIMQKLAAKNVADLIRTVLGD